MPWYKPEIFLTLIEKQMHFCRHYFLEAMLTAKPISLTHYTRAGEIAAYIRGCCLQGKAATVSINSLSRQFGLCETTLKSAFRQRYKISIYNFLLMEKKKHICALLDQTNMSVKEIAIINGYEDLSNFSRDFARMHGVCPTVYRLQQKLKIHNPISMTSLLQESS